MEHIESLEDGLDHSYQLTETIVLEDDDERNQNDADQQTNQLDVISEEQQRSDRSSQQNLSSHKEHSFSYDESSELSEPYSQESQSQNQIVQKEFLDELILQIDQFQELYYLSLEQNHQTQKLHKGQFYQKKSTQVIYPYLSSNKQSFAVKNYRKKGKKIPQIYHPDIWQIKRLYFQLKRLHLISLLKNTFILQNYEPRKCSKSTFLEQVNLVLDSSQNKIPFKHQSKNQMSLRKTDNSVRKIYIQRNQSKHLSKTKENYFDLTYQQSESEQEYQLIQVQEINFNVNEKNSLKQKYDTSLSTTIDFDSIELQNK